jgi:hypothetical protein
MPKRTLAVLAVAAFGALALPFGLPTIAHATGPAYNDLVFAPLPIEVAGTLVEGTSVTICVQPQENGVHLTSAASVYLSINSGQFTAPPAPGGSAAAGPTLTPLTVNPALFTTQATCSFSNSQGSGTAPWAVPVTYTAPSPTIPVNGRDVIVAADASSDVTVTPASGGVAAFGTCNGAGVCKTGAYVFSGVTQYVFSTGSTIAATGTLTAGQPVTFNVTAEDVTSHAVPGSFIDLSLVPSTGGPVGSATAINILGTPPVSHTKTVTNLPTRFGSDANGQVSITYTAANPLSTTGDVDSLIAQNHPTETVTRTTTYTYTGSSPPPTANPYTAITPFRVCDTRPTSQGITANQCDTGSTGEGSGPIGTTPRVVLIQGFGSPAVPAGATAVVLNVTAIAPTVPTFVTVYPDGSGYPGTSNVNLSAHQVVANLVEVGLGAGGKIDVFNAAGTINVAIDIEGFVASSSTGLYNALAAPVRICDTRAVGGAVSLNQCNPGGTAHPIVSTGPVLTFNVHTATDNVPATGVSAVVFNLTAIAPSAPTVLTAYPSDHTRPLASNLNLNPGTAVPNRVIVPVSTTGTLGQVSLWNGAGSVNVAVDIAGYFQATTGAQFTPLAKPFRVCNTQNGNAADGGETTGCAKAMIHGGTALNIDVTGIDGIPQAGQAGAPTAIVANVTAVNATTGTFVTVYPGPNTSPVPNASDLNVSSFLPVANLVVVTVYSVDGTINLYNALGNINFIVDIYGYYS